MAVIDLVTADRVHITESLVQATLPAAVDITAGQLVRINTDGLWEPANAGAAGTADVYGVARGSVRAGFALTAIHEGVMDGWDLSGVDFGSPVYLSNTAGAVDTAAGTVSTVVGRVIPIHGNPLDVGPGKAIYFDCF